MLWSHVSHIGWQLFYWPAGIVLGNLLANMIWEWPSQGIHYWRTHKQNKKQTNHIKKHIDSTAVVATEAAVNDEPVRL